MDKQPSSWAEQLGTTRETLIGKLLKGKESATQLQNLIKKPSSSGEDVGSASAEELALQISRSFLESISILSSCGVNEIQQIVASDDVVQVSSGDRRSKASDRSRKRLGGKDRRGCYRRRNVSQSGITLSSTVEDGRAWRKYGQKEILNSKFPRCYFRCTHKLDQGCKATKQVQMIKEDPLTYQTTYFGNHTCQENLMIMRAPQVISDSDPSESCMLNFEAKPTTKQGPFCLNYALTTTSTGTQEFKNETQSDDVSDNKSCLDSSTILQDPITNTESSSGPKSSKIDGANYLDQEVVSSRVHSCSSTPLHDLEDMESFNTKFADLNDDDLYFDDMEIFRVDC
ncbi:hypothetical protein ACH5RR_019471 [Cinchona calisaya]|uniref:WRKY domain-containing protein n=1 Tax=Cinchona calisaya TaxID=153742 RepID=A0ABD2ZPG8_9GENT